MSGLEKKIEKKRVLVVVDIDETLMMPKLRVEGPPWIGGLVGHDTWVTGFQSLFDRLKASGVEVHFAVITNKPYLDDLIFEVANAFAGLLDLNHPYSHVVQEDLSQEKRFRLCSQVIDISGPTGDAVYVPLDPFGRGQVVPGLVGCSSFSPYEQTPDLPKTPKVICFYPPGRFDLLKFPQVVHWDPRTYQGFLTKADAMKKIADEHGINARDCYLIDNTESILE